MRVADMTSYWPQHHVGELVLSDLEQYDVGGGRGGASRGATTLRWVQIPTRTTTRGHDVHAPRSRSLQQSNGTNATHRQVGHQQGRFQLRIPGATEKPHIRKGGGVDTGVASSPNLVTSTTEHDIWQRRTARRSATLGTENRRRRFARLTRADDDILLARAKAKRLTNVTGYTIDEKDDDNCAVFNATGTKLNRATPRGTDTHDIL